MTTEVPELGPGDPGTEARLTEAGTVLGMQRVAGVLLAIGVTVVAGIALLPGDEDPTGVVMSLVPYGALVDYPHDKAPCLHAVGIAGAQGTFTPSESSWTTAAEAANTAARALAGKRQVPALASTAGGSSIVVQAGTGRPDLPVAPGEVVILEGRELRVEILPVPITRAEVTYVPVQAGWFAGPLEGASAGLALGLSALDAFTPGPLCQGGPVAATGTLTEDGRVGAVDGIDVKAQAASQAGMTLFLVPPGQAAQATVEGSAMQVREVSTLSEAKAAVVAHTAPPA